MAALDARELEIMKVLWEAGPLKPSEIQDRLPYDVKNSALRWQLEALMKAGHVTRRKRGKAFHYRARTPRRRALKSLTRRMADVFSRGSAAAFIGQLIESEDALSDEDLRELRRIAARRASAKGSDHRKGASR